MTRFKNPGLAPAWLAFFLLLAAALPAPARALHEENYFSYVYNEWGDAVPAPAGYSPSRVYYGEDLGAGPLKAPRDLFWEKASQELYIVDSGNNRIVVADQSLRFQREWKELQGPDGVETLKNPGGIFVTGQGTMYICDTGNKRVLVCGEDGGVIASLGLPVSELIDPGLDYQPEKVVVDSAGRIYVKAAGVFSGLISMDPKGAFIQFFGANRVEMTPSMMVEYLWKQLLSREQRSRMASFIPIEYSNVFIDPEDYVYAASVHSANSRGEIKKLNALGVNVLHISQFTQFQYPKDDYGDHPAAVIDNQPVDSMLVDVAVDGQGIITALDAKRGRVFQYDNESNLITVFGGIGHQLGTFQSPSAVEVAGGRVLVMDKTKNSITEFEITPFGELLHQATGLYNDGYYLEAMEPWSRVLDLCENYNLAYIGLGKANLRLENYPEAMRCFRMGYDKKGYSDALKELSIDFGRENLGWILLGLAALSILARLGGRKIQKGLDRAFGGAARRLGLDTMARAMKHPIRAMEEVKYEGRGSWTLVILLLFLFFLSAVLSRQWTGFPFNPNRPDTINLGLILAGTVGLYALWTLSNVAVSSFMSGEGKASQVMIASAYALSPYIVLTLAATALSNVMTLETGVFLTFVRIGAVAWSGVVLAASLMTVHQFTFKKAMGNLVVTLFGMLVIAFLLSLIFSLFQQLYVFLYTIMNEVIFRI